MGLTAKTYFCSICELAKILGIIFAFSYAYTHTHTYCRCRDVLAATSNIKIGTHSAFICFIYTQTFAIFAACTTYDDGGGDDGGYMHDAGVHLSQFTILYKKKIVFHVYLFLLWTIELQHRSVPFLIPCYYTFWLSHSFHLISASHSISFVCQCTISGLQIIICI